MFFWLLDKADRRSSLVGGGVCDCYLLLFVVQQFNTNCDRVFVCHQKLRNQISANSKSFLMILMANDRRINL